MLGTVFLSNIVLNRNYGTGELGVFAATFSAAQILVLGLMSSFTPLIRKEVTVGDTGSDYTGNIWQYRWYISIVILGSLTFLLPIGLYVERRYYVLFLLFVVVKICEMLCDVFYTYYQSKENYRLYGMVKGSHGLILLSLISLDFFYKFGANYIYGMYLTIAISFMVFNLWLNNKRGNFLLDFGLSLSNLNRAIWHEVWPLITNSIVFQFRSRIYVVLLVFLMGETVSGTYSAALMTVTVFTAVSAPIGIVLFPSINKSFHEGASFLKEIKKIILVLFSAGMGLCLIYYFSIPLQLSLIGELPDYAESLFLTTSLGMPFLIAAGGIGHIAVIIGKQKEYLWLSALLLVISLMALFIFTYYFSVIGVGLAFGFISFAQLIILYLFVRYYSGNGFLTHN